MWKFSYSRKDTALPRNSYTPQVRAYEPHAVLLSSLVQISLTAWVINVTPRIAAPGKLSQSLTSRGLISCILSLATGLDGICQDNLGLAYVPDVP